ncbi:MAG: hypothetical protein HN768_04460, partial [Rhodospirillaceae bacterium]|nr:hypothetical protein [Rhodospirillaceae bacterium]
MFAAGQTQGRTAGIHRDITAADHPERPVRFDVVYHFLSMYQNARIRVKLAARETDMVPSITDIHPSANW